MSKAIKNPANSSPTIESFGQLAKAIGRSKSTAYAWAKHEEWPWSKSPPWDPSDVVEMKWWAAHTLRSDGGNDRVASDGFYERFMYYPPIPSVLENGLCRDAEKLPDEIVTLFERQILAGSVQLSAEETRDVVATFIRFRAIMADMCRWFPRWLRGYTEKEIGNRLRSEVYGRIGWIREYYKSAAEDHAPPKRGASNPAADDAPDDADDDDESTPAASGMWNA